MEAGLCWDRVSHTAITRGLRLSESLAEAQERTYCQPSRAPAFRGSILHCFDNIGGKRGIFCATPRPAWVLGDGRGDVSVSLLDSTVECPLPLPYANGVASSSTAGVKFTDSRYSGEVKDHVHSIADAGENTTDHLAASGELKASVDGKASSAAKEVEEDLRGPSSDAAVHEIIALAPKFMPLPGDCNSSRGALHAFTPIHAPSINMSNGFVYF